MTWEELLRRATVQLETAGPMLGTGFLVAPGVVATCAHVVTAGPPVRGRSVALGRDLTLEVTQAFHDPATGLDLALLHVSELDDVEPVSLSADLRTGDALYTFGHPAGLFRAGQPATFTYQGDSRRSPDVPFDLPRAWGAPVGPGHSGSPVVNTRTGAVCGMLSTADKRGSAHLISAADIAVRITPPPPSRAWLEALSDEQLAAGGWRFPPRWLRDLLAASIVAALDDELLRKVYIKQYVQVGGSSDAANVDVDQVLLTADTHVLLTGVAGMGKSTVLRMCLVELAERWLAGDTEPDVPVYLRASALTKPGKLGEQIAVAIDASVSRYRKGTVPAGAFGFAPVPGVRWLMLVDGLDEITDPNRRADVAKMLGSNQRGPYRFVVASRPLSDDELNTLKWPEPMVRAELQPLSMAQLGRMARNWFAAEGLPETSVSAIRAQVYHRFEGAATTPMLVAMLCRLFVNEPDLPLPDGVYGLHDEFVESQRRLQYTAPDEPVAGQIHTALRPYGSALAAAAEVLPGRIDKLLPEAAAAVLNDSRVDVLALLADGTDDLRPGEMTAEDWRKLVRDSARRNGLLTEYGDDLTFFHQTVTEFLGARHHAADRHGSEQLVRDLFGHPRRPELPRDLTSYGLFLIAAWTIAQPDQAVAVLGRVVARHGIKGAIFVADLARRGVFLPSVLRSAAVDALKRTAPTDEWYEVMIPWARAALGDDEGVARLTELATDPSADSDVRVVAAIKLLELPGERGAARLLTGLADDPGLTVVNRLAVAENLAILGDQGGVDRLFGFTRDPRLSDHHRISAAETLGMLDDALYHPALTGLATDPDIHWDDRRWVLRQMRANGSPQYPKALAAIATNPAMHNRARNDAVQLLTSIGGPEYADVLAALVADPAFTVQDRINACETLTDLGDPRGERALALIESYPVPPPDDPLAVALPLGMLHDPHGLDTLADTLSTADFAGAFVTASVLAQAGDRRGLDHLAQSAGDPTLAADERLLAATALVTYGDPRGANELAGLTADGELEPGDRIAAAMTLQRLGDRRHADALAVLASEPATNIDLRIWVAAALGRFDDPRGPDRLAALATDPEVEYDARVRAAIALGKLADVRAADLLAGLADDPARRDEIAAQVDASGRWPAPPDSRVAAANALRALGDPRTIEILAALLIEPTLHYSDRIRVAAVLGRLGDPRGPDLLVEWAADPEADAAVSWFARRKLEALGDPRAASIDPTTPE